MTIARARELVAQIVARPKDSLRQDDPAIAELVALGPETVRAVADAMKGTEVRDHHPHELVATLALLLAEVAKSDPGALLAHLDPAEPNATIYVSALGSAAPKPEIVAALGRMITSADATIRYAAANSLVRLHTPEAAAALVPALSDAYAPVQFAAVQAVCDDDVFRVPDALPPLRRIVADNRIKRMEPETWERAREALEDME